METILLEFAKYGGVVGLAFGLLLWQTIKEKDAMSKQMTKDKDRLLDALTHLTDVVANNTLVMRGVQSTMQVCLRRNLALPPEDDAVGEDQKDTRKRKAV